MPGPIPVIQVMGEMVNRLWQVNFRPENVRMTGTLAQLKTRGLVVGAQHGNVFHTPSIKNIHEKPHAARVDFVAPSGRTTSLIAVLTVHLSSASGYSIGRVS